MEQQATDNLAVDLCVVCDDEGGNGSCSTQGSGTGGPGGRRAGDYKVAWGPSKKGKGQEVPLETLPPLPTPQASVQRDEARVGCTTVIVLSLALPWAADGFIFKTSRELFAGGGLKTTSVRARCLIQAAAGNTGAAIPLLLLWLCSLCTLLCLAGLMYGDPGVVHRSEDTCYPIPGTPCAAHIAIPDTDVDTAAVVAKLRDASLQKAQEGRSMDNINGEAGSFCVRCTHDHGAACPAQICRSLPLSLLPIRCLVWRPPRAHHCRTCGECLPLLHKTTSVQRVCLTVHVSTLPLSFVCMRANPAHSSPNRGSLPQMTPVIAGRCVAQFDHHCNFYGVCVAGSCIGRGNMLYFKLILVCAVVGIVAFIAAVAALLSDLQLL